MRRRRTLGALAVLSAAATLASIGASAAQEPGGPPAAAEGRALFLEGCSSCHGEDARGLPARGPSLYGAGAASADFYLRTGRMPLDDPRDQPRRSESPYTPEQIDALVAYVGGLGHGPPVPRARPERGDLTRGLQLFAEHCAGCHQIVARGGVAGEGVVPDLREARPVDVAEAVVVGPYVMPRFPGLTQAEVDSLARYVQFTQKPDDRGGWGIGHIGPVPEGIVTWLLAALTLLLVIRLIGERTGP